MSNRDRGSAAKSGTGRSREKRGKTRVKRRLMIKYGVDAADKTGFTKNISNGGLYIKTNSVLKPGTTIQVEVHTPGKTFSMWARVSWAKRVPPQLAHILECGMGVQIIEPDLEWIEFTRQWELD